MQYIYVFSLQKKLFRDNNVTKTLFQPAKLRMTLGVILESVFYIFNIRMIKIFKY